MVAPIAVAATQMSAILQYLHATHAALSLDNNKVALPLPKCPIAKHFVRKQLFHAYRRAVFGVSSDACLFPGAD